MQGSGCWLAGQLCVCVRACVRLRLGPRLLPEVEFHKLPFHYSYKATTRLHRVQSCKNFFFSGFLLLFSFFHGHSCNGKKHLWKRSSLHFVISGARSPAQLIPFPTVWVETSRRWRLWASSRLLFQVETTSRASLLFDYFIFDDVNKIRWRDRIIPDW